MTKISPSPHKEKTYPTYLGKDFSELIQIGARHTSKEIAQQPELWLKTYDFLMAQKNTIELFLSECFRNEKLEIILTGAGTSAFIGKILEGPFQKNTLKPTRAIATTDLLLHPQHYFNGETPTLLISFARSGNSPESVATLNIANLYCKKIYHLIITCSPTGKLAENDNNNPTQLFLLPEEACDQGLAMTGSFSSMLLAGLLISRIDILDKLHDQVKRLASYGTEIISTHTAKLAEIAALPFERVVFLGSGPMQGTACESHLKMQELTDGKIICKYDSFMGLRHGPKVIINPSTLIVYLFTNDQYAHQYEIDLVKSINDGEKGLYQLGVSEGQCGVASLLDFSMRLSNSGTRIDEEFLSVCSVLPAQILSFFKSLHLKIQPDNPSHNGAISRVVEGVTIYPVPDENELQVADKKIY